MRRALFLALISVLVVAAARTETPDAASFPTLGGTNLEKQDIALPTELPGKANLIIFGFVQDHQEDINTWIPRCEELEREVAGFRFFEVPFLAGQYRLIRFWIDGGMRRGIPDRAARERTITVYGGRSAAMRQLGITDLGKIYAFLIRPSGEVLWRSEGRWSQEKDTALRAALKRDL